MHIPDTLNFKTFVITLPEAKERQVHMTKMLNNLGIPFAFFDAVDGRGFDVPSHPAYNKTLRRLYFGRDMTGGEMGVMLSHRKIYEQMIAENIDMALIFEDDALVIGEGFRAVVEALVSGEQDFDLVRFLGSDKVAALRQYKKRMITNQHSLNRLRTTPGGAHAYIIRRSGAEKMLKVLRRVYLPIDTLMGHIWLSGLKAYVTQPGMVIQDEAQEQFIGAARFRKKPETRGAMRALFPLTRAGFKAYEGVMKNISYTRGRFQDRRGG
jgi:glycosyl transferase family 25